MTSITVCIFLFDVKFECVLTFHICRDQAKKRKTGGSTLNVHRSGMDEADVHVPDIPEEYFGAYVDPPEEIGRAHV